MNQKLIFQNVLRIYVFIQKKLYNLRNIHILKANQILYFETIDFSDSQISSFRLVKLKKMIETLTNSFIPVFQFFWKQFFKRNMQNLNNQAVNLLINKVQISQINDIWEAFKDRNISNDVWIQTCKAQIYGCARKYQQALECQRKIINYFFDLARLNSHQSQKSIQANDLEIPHFYFKIKGNNFYQKLPETVEISENKFGACLVATRSFKKNDVIFRSTYLLIEESVLENEYTFTVQGKQQKTFKYHKKVHSVKHQDQRMIYGFDSNTNHSCNPSTSCIFYENGVYDVMALKDINPGQQLNMDYAIFDYECQGHEIPECLCGQKNCRKKMMGFNNLSTQDQLKLMSTIDPLLLKVFLKNNQIIDFRSYSQTKNCLIGYDFNNQQIIFTSTQQISQGDEILNFEPVIKKLVIEQQKGLYSTKDGLRIEASLKQILKNSDIKLNKFLNIDLHFQKITARITIPSQTRIVLKYNFQ